VGSVQEARSRDVEGRARRAAHGSQAVTVSRYEVVERVSPGPRYDTSEGEHAPHAAEVRRDEDGRVGADRDVFAVERGRLYPDYGIGIAQHGVTFHDLARNVTIEWGEAKRISALVAQHELHGSVAKGAAAVVEEHGGVARAVGARVACSRKHAQNYAIPERGMLALDEIGAGCNYLLQS